MIVKVCGMRDATNIRNVTALGVDMIGFIFWNESPRFVPMISSRAGIIPDYSEEKVEKLKVEGYAVMDSASQKEEHSPLRVGVFVDDMPQNIVTRVYNYGLDYVQLHGNESRAMIENLRWTIDPDIHRDIKIIKAVSVRSAEDLAKCQEYGDIVDLFLFDTKAELPGGSGKRFDWDVLSAYNGQTPFLISGGIGPDDVERIRAFGHPQFAGIDLNSRFETEPGLKDVDLLRDFLTALRA